ncbi:unnamed protein product, partial [Discosporangium mesarthrocarpum]
MLTCHSKLLQVMPYAMADNAQDPPLYLGNPRSKRFKKPLPCIAIPAKGVTADVDIPGRGGMGDEGSFPAYCDHGTARVTLPPQLARPGQRRVHLLTRNADGSMGSKQWHQL